MTQGRPERTADQEHMQWRHTKRGATWASTKTSTHTSANSSYGVPSPFPRHIAAANGHEEEGTAGNEGKLTHVRKAPIKRCPRYDPSLKRRYDCDSAKTAACSRARTPPKKPEG